MNDLQKEKLREMSAAPIAYITQLTKDDQQEAFAYIVFLMEYTLAKMEKRKNLPST